MKDSNSFLSKPISGMGKVYQAPSSQIIDTNKPNYKQPWSKYIPECTLHDKLDCQNYSIQKSNIKKEGIYQGIEIEGDKWMKRVCKIAKDSVKNKGGPFGAIVLQIDDKTNELLRFWESNNQVTFSNDPSAHAEIMAIRSACHSLGVFNLGKIKKEESKMKQTGETSSCVIYSSTEPCPMCYSAIYWANISTLFFAATKFDAAAKGVGFSDEAIYQELAKPYHKRKTKVFQCATDNSLDAFNLWKRSDKKQY